MFDKSAESFNSIGLITIGIGLALGVMAYGLAKSFGPLFPLLLFGLWSLQQGKNFPIKTAGSQEVIIMKLKPKITIDSHFSNIDDGCGQKSLVSERSPNIHSVIIMIIKQVGGMGEVEQCSTSPIPISI